MEYLQKCFYKSTNWNEDNIFSNITATSEALIDFPIPNGCKLDISSKSTEHLASSFTLSNRHVINGSIAYLYASMPLRSSMNTREISLQDAIAGFRIIEPYVYSPGSLNETRQRNKKQTLLYGRMYFPGSALEAMMIKQISPYTQLLVKCINNPQMNLNGTLIAYLQKNTPTYLRELIYSTNEALIGFRCLYNFGSFDKSLYTSNNSHFIPKFDNSILSVGSEIWYAAKSMSPGLSTALRYSTRSTSTGKPLTMTLACNPILGQMSSAYTVKTSVRSTFSSRYDFNFFSYRSNLSLGFELYNYSNSPDSLFSGPVNQHQHGSSRPGVKERRKSPHHVPEAHFTLPLLPAEKTSLILNPIQRADNYYHINPSLLPSHNSMSTENGSRLMDESVMSAFQNSVNKSNFSSVLKASTSLDDKVLRFLWEGRMKDFLVSTGVKLSLNPITHTPEFNRFGISFSYSC